MTVRDYYTKHFNELTPETQLHFATRLKNWYKTAEFDDFLEENEPSSDLDEIFHNNNSTSNNLELRKPYLEKYKGILGIEATLCRVNHMLNEYQKDVRRDLQALISKEDLYDLSDRLLSDDAALVTLSTYAVNTICLTEILFPRQIDVFALLAQKALHFSGDPTLLTYLATHILICDTAFYHRPITSANLPIYQSLLVKYVKLISQNLTPIPLDAKLEFLVVSKLVNSAKNPSVNAVKDHPATWPQAATGFFPLAAKIQLECKASLQKSPYLIDPRMPHKADLSSSEYRNTLYILSGLDEKP